MTRAAMVTVEDFLAAAGVVASRCSAGFAPSVSAWILWNRARAAMAWRATTGGAHPVFGDGSLAGAAWSLRCDAEPDTRSFWRSAAALCAVLSGDKPDPTGGATDWRRSDHPA